MALHDSSVEEDRTAAVRRLIKLNIMRRVLLLLLLTWVPGTVSVVSGGQTGAAGGQAKSSLLGRDGRLQRRIALRWDGQPLGELLSAISREVALPLRATSTEIGDLRVAVFVSDQPAFRTLDALLEMLNMTPERGFRWVAEGTGRTRGYRLMRDPSARLREQQRLREATDHAASEFIKRVNAARQDPKFGEKAQDPAHRKLSERAALLVGSLSDGQLHTLVQEGSVLIRHRDASPLQRTIIDRMESDWQHGVGTKVIGEPEEFLYRDLNPADFSVVLEHDGDPTNPSIRCQFNFGPDKGFWQNTVFAP